MSSEEAKRNELYRKSEEKKQEGLSKFRQAFSTDPSCNCDYWTNNPPKAGETPNRCQNVCLNLTDSSGHNESISDENKSGESIDNIGNTIMSTFYEDFAVVLGMVIKILALSISLNCNRKSNIIIRIILLWAAYSYSYIYFAIYIIRIVIFKKDRCKFDNYKFLI
tara:strand:+ start:249 stop:743 length:495 start_codon:yes stop_codon:yes gene_type:complete